MVAAIFCQSLLTSAATTFRRSAGGVKTGLKKNSSTATVRRDVGRPLLYAERRTFFAPFRQRDPDDRAHGGFRAAKHRLRLHTARVEFCICPESRGIASRVRLATVYVPVSARRFVSSTVQFDRTLVFR